MNNGNKSIAKTIALIHQGEAIQIQRLSVVPCCLSEALAAACAASCLCGTRIWMGLL